MSDQDKRVFEELELNASNVGYLYEKLIFILPVPGAIKVQALSKDVTDNPSEIVYFNPIEVAIHSQDIDFMFGQLYAAHNRTNKYFSAQLAYFNYQEKNWTHSSEAMMWFFELGIANKSMMPFKKGKDSQLYSMLNPNLLPALSPSDPQYNDFLPQYQSQYQHRFKVPPELSAPAKKEQFVHFLDLLEPSEVSSLIRDALMFIDLNSSLSEEEKRGIKSTIQLLERYIGIAAEAEIEKRRSDAGALNEVIKYRLRLYSKSESKDTQELMEEIRKLVHEGATLFDVYDAIIYDTNKTHENILRTVLPSGYLDRYKR